jgi:hypothetical protein
VGESHDKEGRDTAMLRDQGTQTAQTARELVLPLPLPLPLSSGSHLLQRRHEHLAEGLDVFRPRFVLQVPHRQPRDLLAHPVLVVVEAAVRTSALAMGSSGPMRV